MIVDNGRQKIVAKETYSDYKYYFTDIYCLYDENPIIYFILLIMYYFL
jgi:hypothetical protein